MNLVSATRQLAPFDPSTPGRFSGVHRGPSSSGMLIGRRSHRFGLPHCWIVKGSKKISTAPRQLRVVESPRPAQLCTRSRAGCRSSRIFRELFGRRESNPFHADRNPFGITWACDRRCRKFKGSTFRLAPFRSAPRTRIPRRLTTG